MHFRLDKAVLERYPEAEIGYVVADVSVEGESAFTERLKEGLAAELNEAGINATNFAAHPRIAAWRSLYAEQFGVSPKSYRSSVEALVRRIVMGKKMWKINTIVDLYNCCSTRCLVPIGGYDVASIEGDVSIRMGKTGENFLALGERKAMPVEPHHIVYADEEKVLCWLWNHKDAEASCITPQTRQVVFFFDFLGKADQGALEELSSNLERLGCKPLKSGVLTSENPEASFI